MKIRILFDKESTNEQLHCGWGMAYLVNECVLFDTGEKPEYLVNNIQALSLDISMIRDVVISHNHWDHRGGVWKLLEVNEAVVVRACTDFIDEFKEELKRHRVQPVTEDRKISSHIYTTGCMEVVYKDKVFKEQALIVETERGLTILCGCSHVSVLDIIKKTKELFPDRNIHFLAGGFHLMNREMRFIKYVVEEIKRQGVEKVGPAHCTGFEAVHVFKETYGKDCLDIKTGIIIEV